MSHTQFGGLCAPTRLCRSISHFARGQLSTTRRRGLEGGDIVGGEWKRWAGSRREKRRGVREQGVEEEEEVEEEEVEEGGVMAGNATFVFANFTPRANSPLN